MPRPSFWFALVCFILLISGLCAQIPGGSRLAPNLHDNIARPLRYRPDGHDFVIEDGREFFNRPLYGGNTAFRVDGGDKPEFVLYLPGRGGNLRLGFRAAGGATKWLHAAATIGMRYRPGTLRYEIRDPLLGDGGVLRITALAYHQTEGLLIGVVAEGTPAGGELIWAYGGANGQRGARDGDIGTERVPISEWFQLKPEFCRENAFEIGSEGERAATFTLRAQAATILGVMPAGARLRVADSALWNDPAALLTAESFIAPAQPVIVGAVTLRAGETQWLSLQRLPVERAAATQDLATYREVTAGAAKAPPPPAPKLAAAFARADLARLAAETEKHFATLRTRVSVETPDPFLDAAVAALNVAADAVWDEPQQAIMHGAIAWRTKLLGWRGPYSLDALGWHDRARRHFEYWATRQNTAPIPEKLPPPDENANLARSEAALHSNGDLSNSHYDMNLVFVDAFFRHLRWTGDLAFAKKMWPVIERHLAWEQRMFRREFDAGGGLKLPLYEAYAAIWASDDLQYHGGGAMHATADNYFHNREAARVARLIGADPSPYQREAQLLERGMRALLWVENKTGGGHFAEFKDLLGLRRVHPAAALWTFYHTMDSEVPTPQEAWTMARQVDRDLPHLPIAGEGVPSGFHTIGTSNWLPYDWSINNVVMAEAVHGALGFWQAGRADEAWKITKGSLLAAMFLGISPGNVGSMSYLDVYRRESQRDFADGSGVLSRALIEGLFGVRPDALAGELRFEPGWPAEWDRARLAHPDFAVEFRREGGVDKFSVEQRFAKPLALRLRLTAARDRVQAVRVDGAAAKWLAVPNAVGWPRIDVLVPAGGRRVVEVEWAGAPIAPPALGASIIGAVRQGDLRWMTATLEPVRKSPPLTSATLAAGTRHEAVDLTAHFNDRVTEIFKNEYRAPRSPFVSLAQPKQGIGGWAGGVNATADIDDSGWRALAERGGGQVSVGGIPFSSPGAREARNVVFTSQWDNYPREVSVPLSGRAQRVVLMMAGSTNPMQSRFENGEVVATYTDGTTTRLALENPTTWWPIQEDYFIDDFQFRVEGPLPVRVDLKTGNVRALDATAVKGRGGRVAGGAATVLTFPLDPSKELKSLTVRALANEVVIGLMAATLVRE